SIVGESGSGKSVTARSIMGLATPPAWIANGDIRLEGQSLLELSESEWREVRGGGIAMVFQDASRALNPTMTVGRQVLEAVRLHTTLSKKEARGRVLQMLDATRIPDAKR